MDKEQILKAIDYQGDCKEIKSDVTRIVDTLSAIPSGVDLGAMTSVEYFINSGSFGEFNHPQSVTNDISGKNRILSDLKSILIELASWIRENPLQAKYNYITSNQAKGKIRRRVMIALLVMIATVSIVLYCLQVKGILNVGIDIAEIIGIVDLVLGIGGWIYELADDSKKEAVCSAVQEIGDSKSDKDLLAKTDNYCKAKRRNVILCLFNFGTIQQIEKQETTNGRN